MVAEGDGAICQTESCISPQNVCHGGHGLLFVFERNVEG